MGIVFNSLPVVPLRITSHFGIRKTNIEGATGSEKNPHKGVDLGGDRSKPETCILSVARGKVKFNYWNNVRGWVIIISHNGFDTLYQHLKSQSPLKVGSAVKAGQTIGIMGNSSKILKIAVHLHFELHVGGKPIDGEPYLLDIRSEKEMDYSEFKEHMTRYLSEQGKQPLSDWAAKEDNMKKAVSSGITDGTRPRSFTTREEVITLMGRAKCFK